MELVRASSTEADVPPPIETTTRPIGRGASIDKLETILGERAFGRSVVEVRVPSGASSWTIVLFSACAFAAGAGMAVLFYELHERCQHALNATRA